MTADPVLPPAFAALAPFVPLWARPTTAARAARRTDSTPEERAAFFAAASPLLGAALEHLDRHSLAALPPPEQRLMDLMLALAHVALAVEMQGPDEPRHAPLRERMRITRSVADPVQPA